MRIDREQHVPHSSDHSLYLIKLLSSALLRCTPDGSICLSPPNPKYNERFARPSTMASCISANISENKNIYIYITHVIMNRHGRHNIRNGIVRVQTGHSTCTCTAHCVRLNFEHTKIRIVQKKSATKNPPKSFEFISGRMVLFPKERISQQIVKQILDGFRWRCLSILAGQAHCGVGLEGCRARISRSVSQVPLFMRQILSLPLISSPGQNWLWNYKICET